MGHQLQYDKNDLRLLGERADRHPQRAFPSAPISLDGAEAYGGDYERGTRSCRVSVTRTANDHIVANLRKRFELYTGSPVNKGGVEMSTLVTILRPIVQLGMNSWLDFGLWRSHEWVHPLQLPRGDRSPPA